MIVTSTMVAAFVTASNTRLIAVIAGGATILAWAVIQLVVTRPARSLRALAAPKPAADTTRAPAPASAPARLDAVYGQPGAKPQGTPRGGLLV